MLRDCELHSSEDLDADLDVSVDVDPVVLAGQDDGAVAGERDVEALRVLDLAFQRRQELKRRTSGCRQKLSNLDLALKTRPKTDATPYSDHSYKVNRLNETQCFQRTENLATLYRAIFSIP